MAFGIAEIISALLPTLLAAGGGALASKLSSGSQGQGGGNFLTGYPFQSQQVPRFDQLQGGAISQILGAGLQGLSGLTKGFDFGPIEEQARTQFAQQTVPSIAERFTAMGGQRSSAFPQILGQAGAGLEQSLAALKSDVGLQQQGQQQNLILQLLGLGLTPRTENVYQAPRGGVFDPILQGLGASLPGAIAGLSGLSNLGSSGGCSGGSCLARPNAPIPRQTTFGREFTNPNLYSPGMTNLLNTRF